MNAIAPLQDAFWRACETLVFRHAAPWDLDEALTAWGYGIGPCEAQDLVGLDVVLSGRQGQAPTPVLPRMVAEGRLGKKGGWGYYRYPGGGGAVIDPLIDDLVQEEAWFAKVPRVELDAQALVDALHEQMAPTVRADPATAVALLHFPKDGFARLP